MMGIAKGLIDSGYQPEKTLVFCAMAAEEWGVSNTRYDWSTGAYNQILPRPSRMDRKGDRGHQL